MAAVLRKIMPVKSSDSRDDDADDVYKPDYSFAQVYHGPPIANIPRANPLDIDQIPTALRVSSSSLLNGISVPVIQPIHRTNPGNKKLIKESEFVSNSDVFAGSITGSRILLKGPDTDAAHETSSSSSVGLDISGTSSGEEGNQKLSNEAKSSGDLIPSDELDHFYSSNNHNEGGDRDFAGMESTKSGSNSPVHSSVDLSGKEENGKAVNPGHATRAAVTFIDPPLSSEADGESVFSENENLDVLPRAERRGKKGSCYRCLTGNRFTEKEVCIVCSAKYCFNCVLRAMGSMPEGRKCVNCIGKRIDESRRRSLGKSSRILKRLLTDLEVKQIMNAEISCKANRLPSQLIYVNGEPLSENELIILQTCSNPPKKLKPGRYWYDKVAGYWGKEGEKPCQIISPLLNIGGNIRRDASNGDTDILINNREITKVELLMLQLAGVQCEGRPHFWVSADGSYQEEGQNHIKGSIWDKKRVRLACAILSLPMPPDSPGREPEDYIDYEQKKLHKFLLVGNEKSGTSIVYKQARFLYNVPFSEKEHENIKLMIQTNLYSYLGTLLEARERFEEESLIEMRNNQSANESCNGGDTEQTGIKTIYSICPRLKAFSDWLLKEKEFGNLEVIFPAASREYAPFVVDLWKDPAIQATYNRSGQEMLPRSATHFLERAMDISRPDYEPSDADILYAEGISSIGLSCMEFSFPKSPHGCLLDPDYQHDSSLRYQLVRLHPKSLGENCKWLEMFEDVDIVIFSLSLSDYDEYIEDTNGFLVNKMMATKQLFESIVTHPTLVEKQFLLFLNKFDLLEAKIESVPLTVCEWFQDFNPVISHNRSSRHNPSMAHRAFHYIAVKFKKLFESLVDPFVDRRRTYRNKLFVAQVTGLERGTVDDALRYAREIVRWRVEEPSVFHEISTTSIEASSSS